MDSTREIPERVATGVPGLDRLLEGGFLAGGVYIVQGPPGAGKTILANQICTHHARSGGRAVYVTLLAESHTRMLQHMRRMSFFDVSLIPSQIYYVSAFRVLEEEGLGGLLTLLRKQVTSHNASLLVLDGLVSAEESAPNAAAYKKFIHELQSVLGILGSTALLLGNSERDRAFRPDHTMVDGIVELSHELSRLRTLRSLHIRKMRGTEQVTGRHTVQITENGIVVHPRLETITRALDGSEVTPQGGRLGFGIKELDTMLGGGLPENSSTMLLGPTGSGKTILGLQWLAEGARQGESGVHFGFHERPPTILQKSKRIGLAVELAVEQGRVSQVWHRPVEGNVDLLGDALLREVRRRRASRLVIDGIDGFEVQNDDSTRVHEVFAALAEELEREGVTVLFTAETRELLGAPLTIPVRGVSAMTHNIVALRHVEVDGETRRMIAILKMRDSGYDATLRELEIGEEGVSLGGAISSGLPLARAAKRKKTSTRKKKTGGRRKVR